MSWSVQQLTVLERFSGALSLTKLVEELAHHGDPHNEHAVVQQAHVSGISLLRRRRRHDWSPDEDRLIRETAGLLSAAEIAARIRHECLYLRTETAVWTRAARLGIPLQEHHRALTLRQLMAIFPAHNRYIASWAEQGYLRAQRTSDGRCGRSWRFAVEDVETFIREYPWLFDWKQVKAGRWRDLARIASLRSPWLKVTQVAALLRQRPVQIRALARAGQIEGAVHDGYRWRIPRQAIERWRETPAS